MKHSPYNSKHVVFIYDVCLKNIAQAASQRCKSHLLLYAICTDCTSKCQRVSLQCNVSAIMFPFISYTYFNGIKQRLSVQLLFKFQLMPLFQDRCKILRLERVFLGSLIVSSVDYVRVCFSKSYDPPPFHIEVFDLTPSLLVTKNFNDPPQIWPAINTDRSLIRKKPSYHILPIIISINKLYFQK